MDEQAGRRRELAAVVHAGLDPAMLWPSYFSQARCSEFELSAYLHGALSLPGSEHPHGVVRGGGPGKGSQPAAATERSADSPARSSQGPKVADEDLLAALGAAGRGLLTPERAEAERLQSLRETGLLHSGAEEMYDRIVVAAKEFFGVSTASVSLIAEDAQFLKSAVGPLREETPRDIAFCTQTVEANAMLVVPDTHTDGRFVSNPLVVGEPYIRFYAGYPLHGPRGWNIGTLCIIDQEPRTFRPSEQQVLRELAAIIQIDIDART
ncbi:GAF domain-containing protein [Pseudarthrobacter sp. NS4]|uniref:GAF domain-containing protein n=1 Tax=Pseudarthrobacter sp. NS4 TaxID=2973976 RepID=UPI0021615BC5|nr:GAF domain-containing protein [Pseudarthrobacter sp. NS4]